MRNVEIYELNTTASLLLLYHYLLRQHTNLRNKKVRLQGVSHFKSLWFDFPN